MDATILNRIGAAAALVLALSTCPAVPPAWAGGHGGVVFRPGGAQGGWHGMAGGMRPPTMGPGARMSMRGLPPVSGVIHERPGMRPYLSGYGHTNTAGGFPASARGMFGAYGRGGAAPVGAGSGAYGHTATGLRGFGPARPGFVGYRNAVRALPVVYGAGRPVYGARGARQRLGYGRVGGRFVSGYGGGYAGGGYADSAFYGYGGGYGTQGVSASAGLYGSAGIYGRPAIDTQASSYGGAYISETPLAATYAEPPLAPSPGSGYGYGDSYAYAASNDVSYPPRRFSVNRVARSGCDCGPRARAEPIVYRYGVGTAY